MRFPATKKTRNPVAKCFHGIYDESACAICKDWPSYEKMHRLFPDLSRETFLVMTPEERLQATKTGVLQQ